MKKIMLIGVILSFSTAIYAQGWGESKATMTEQVPNSGCGKLEVKKGNNVTVEKCTNVTTSKDKTTTTNSKPKTTINVTNTYTILGRDNKPIYIFEDEYKGYGDVENK